MFHEYDVCLSEAVMKRELATIGAWQEIAGRDCDRDCDRDCGEFKFNSNSFREVWSRRLPGAIDTPTYTLTCTRDGNMWCV
jgi:hypothetical protein